MRWYGIAYLIFVAALVGWLLLSFAYGLAPYCVAGSEWTRSTCFFPAPVALFRLTIRTAAPPPASG